ncbi:PSP1 domain-containing protein [Membranihabitans marinus]|uniref:PSP1 domain-containing protein n=1 Tax=Membranihabitans marinus TaxID=1227546 RepID=UPI001F3062BA|nr:regulatory iron-sulfur-containing complex subunit RicT [Membranihabitans marinus]
MGCESCGSGDGKPKGCKSNGDCSTGGCNKLNTFDWLKTYDITDVDGYNVMEVSFKAGSHKYFYTKPDHLDVGTGDMVVVDTGNGYDVGQISLSGELVRLQLKKKNISQKNSFNKIVRLATEKDISSIDKARDVEKNTLVRARAIARSLNLDMKISDIEYQADLKKATFYFIANGRVDFRELIKQYAREFHIKIEMRQIGSRQESALVGGIGSCGRELCCSTWLTNFSSVTTSAARYQNLALNQSKLTGQCGRLKCCLNYELDTYIEALKDYPSKARFLKTKMGKAELIKTDIFKRIMYYSLVDKMGKTTILSLSPETAKKINAANKKGEFPDKFDEIKIENISTEEDEEVEFEENLTGIIELPDEKKKRNNRNRSGNQKNRRSKNNNRRSNRPNKPKTSGQGDADSKGGKTASGSKEDNSNAPNKDNRGGKPKSNNKRRSRPSNRSKKSGKPESKPNTENKNNNS